ncbi:MAG: capping complex subunit for YIEGIA [Bacillota bacterium]
MEVALKEQILAAVTSNPEKVMGNLPVFITKDQSEAEKISLLLSRILKAMTHDLENGVYIIVKH